MPKTSQPNNLKVCKPTNAPVYQPRQASDCTIQPITGTSISQPPDLSTSQLHCPQASKTTSFSVPHSYLKLQARAEALGGVSVFAARLEAIELIQNDFINLCAQILSEYLHLRDLNLSAAAKLLSLDAKTLTKLEKADKNFPIQIYLETIDAYRSL